METWEELITDAEYEQFVQDSQWEPDPETQKVLTALKEVLDEQRV